MPIDTTFDFRSDANGGDPDKTSPTLRRYHQALWSKPLPDGTRFSLDVTTPDSYLHHRSGAGEFYLSSDAVIPTFALWSSAKPIIDQIPAADREGFLRCAYTIGGMMIFPANQVDSKRTINQARGMFRWAIADRLDLTVEAIRRHYVGQPSPLAETLARYSAFFAPFEDFRGYVNFFLLQDLVSDDYAAVRFFLPFDDFGTSALPADLNAYVGYRRRSIEFVQARNRRIGSLPVSA